MLRCETTAEVQHAVKTARELGFPLSVRGGGHDWAGRAIRVDGLVIDLSSVRAVSVHGRIGTVSGGAITEDVDATADQVGLTAATGTVGAVGMTSLAFGVVTVHFAAVSGWPSTTSSVRRLCSLMDRSCERIRIPTLIFCGRCKAEAETSASSPRSMWFCSR